MQIIREIRTVTTPSITIQIPEVLRQQALEILILPVISDALRPQYQKESDEESWPKDLIRRFSGCLPDFPDVESEGPYEDRNVCI